MHGNDPVNWQPWHPDLIDKAKQQNKLLFLSSGYFACHWCHVMQQENYLNPNAAAILNSHFISVKIDRELEPDLDRNLIDFSQQVTGHAGWPQHVVLTPSGYPFAAFIYLETDSFQQRLNSIVQQWQQSSSMIEQLAQLHANQQQNALSTHGALPSKKQLTSALLQTIQQQKDELSGGVTRDNGSLAKFPNAPLLETLLTLHPLPEAIEEWLEFTLTQMQSQHLHDHIYGGFYRYTIDAEWQIPHFEKMAYTSAQLASVYFLAAKRFNRDDFLVTAQQTLLYLEEQLYNSDSGLFKSSQSALDAQGQEGGVYLWSKSALVEQLTQPQFTVLKKAWRLDEPSPYPLGWHPAPIADAQQWSQIKTRLANTARKIPTDSKQIISWNALILKAYAIGYITTQQSRLKQQANQLASTLSYWLTQQNPPRALDGDGKPMQSMTLEDYAQLYDAFTLWQQAGVDSKPQLKRIQNHIKTLFYRPEIGWQHSSPLAGLKQTPIMADYALPSATAILHCAMNADWSLATKAMLNNPVQHARYWQALEQCY